MLGLTLGLCNVSLFIAVNACTELSNTWIYVFCDKNLVRDNMCCEDNLRVPNELSRGLHDVLAFEAVRILTTFFFGAEKLLYY
jgi:hypothetical protein